MAETKKISNDVRGRSNIEYLTSRVTLEDGQATTVHIVTHPLATTRVRVVVFPEAERLLHWCQRTGVRHAMTGGYFLRKTGKPLGRMWMRGTAIDSEPFGKHWADKRGALHAMGRTLWIAPLEELPHYPVGDLITAGPILVRDGGLAVAPDGHFEGIPETWQGELDDDWTRVRAMRTAIGYDAHRIWRVACDGPSMQLYKDGRGGNDNAGLTIIELARVLQGLGATHALNLDGGGGATLIHNQQLVNRPVAGRHDQGHEVGEVMAEGRPIHTGLAFLEA